MKSKLFSSWAVWIVQIAVLLSFTTSHADLIDFEDFNAGTQLSSVTTETNTVTFNVGRDLSSTTMGFVVGVGSPPEAFTPLDTPYNYPQVGDRLFSDENATLTGGAAVHGYNYYFSFDRPVYDVKLAIFDYGDVYPSGPGSTASLIAYSGLFSDEIESDTYVVPAGGQIHDGWAELLGVISHDTLINSAALIFSEPDIGTGIDNIEFTTAAIPDPTALFLLGSACLVGLAGFRRKFRKS